MKCLTVGLKGKTESPQKLREAVLSVLQSSQRPVPAAALAFYFDVPARKIDKLLASFESYRLVKKVTIVKTISWQYAGLEEAGE